MRLLVRLLLSKKLLLCNWQLLSQLQPLLQKLWKKIKPKKKMEKSVQFLGSFSFSPHLKIIYPRGIGPTYELYSSSRRTAVVPLLKNYMQFFWLFFWAGFYGVTRGFTRLIMKTKYICHVLISPYAKFCSSPTI